MKQVYIVAYGRTPIGSLNGSLASISGTELGSIAIKEVVKRSGIDKKDIDEVIMGNVLQANNGQAPARQAAVGADLDFKTCCTTINKVCASGMKSIALAAQSIQLGMSDVVVAGGFESMTNSPYYITKARNGYRFGNSEIIDSIVRDGLQDPFKKNMMGNIAEICAKKYNFSREAQDEFAISSYKRATEAYDKNLFEKEMIKIEIPQKNGDSKWISQDDEYKNIKWDKVATVKPAFEKEGTVTSVNASKINDGAAAMILISEEKMLALGLKPIAKLIGYADAEQDPDWFTTAPAVAIPKAIKNAGLESKDISYYEINEAFSAVALANIQELNLDPNTVNPWGGAVALGHPIGGSGARIACTIISVLKETKSKYGVAAICNGGGGATALVFENL